MTAEPIGQILREQALLTEQQLSDALRLQAEEKSPQRIGQILVREGYVTETDVLKALSRQWEASYLDTIPPEKLNRDLVTGLPIEFLRRHAMLPCDEGDGTVTLAVADPLDVTAFDAAARILGRPCKRALCAAATIEDGLSRYYYENDGSDSGTLSELDSEQELTGLSLESGAEDLLDLAHRAPVVRLVNTFLFQAVQSRASDIHIEPYEQEVKVRFRIDGVLHHKFTLSRHYVAALVSRLKVMADLNVAERRLPQDGRSRIKIGEKEVDIRVSTVPSSGGERVVLRLLDKAGGHFGLDQLGFAPETEGAFRRLIGSPYGIVLLTGPTGSGKTTTLYGALRELNTDVRNIMTVEDPIEYQIFGIGQIQIQPKIGLTFAHCLRHILRQDPDVIMVGEIRDVETARIAIQSALTGHLVLSTLHTNDAAGAVTRLIDMGVEPYLVCSSVIGIMAQRLVRAICPKCKTLYTPTQQERRVLATSPLYSDGETLSRGAGCPYCIATGYRGRTGIFELLTVDDPLRELVMARARSELLRQAAVRNGMHTLREDGMRKVFAGQTTIEEVLRVTQEDTVADDREGD